MMKRILAVSMIAAACTLGGATALTPTPAKADLTPYMQCSVWALQSCLDEFPRDGAAQEQCYYDKMDLHCAALPGDPNG